MVLTSFDPFTSSAVRAKDLKPIQRPWAAAAGGAGERQNWRQHFSEKDRWEAALKANPGSSRGHLIFLALTVWSNKFLTEKDKNSWVDMILHQVLACWCFRTQQELLVSTMFRVFSFFGKLICMNDNHDTSRSFLVSCYLILTLLRRLFLPLQNGSKPMMTWLLPTCKNHFEGSLSPRPKVFRHIAGWNLEADVYRHDPVREANGRKRGHNLVVGRMEVRRAVWCLPGFAVLLMFMVTFSVNLFFSFFHGVFTGSQGFLGFAFC